MDDNGDGDGSKPREIRIAEFSTGGYIVFLNEEFSKLFNAGNVKDNKLVIISAVGDRRSGKSLMLNILLQYLKSDGAGNWINPLTKKENAVPVTGFEMCNKSLNPGIYAWPQIFKHPEETEEEHKKWGLVLDIVLPEDDRPKNQDAMNDILTLWSSLVIDNRINDIKMDLVKSVTNLKIFLSSGKAPWGRSTIKKDSDPDLICKHFNFIVHDSTAEDHKKAKETFVNEIQSKKFPSESSVTLFRKRENDSIPIISSDGCLTTEARVVNEYKRLCSQIMDCPPIKKIPNGVQFTLFMSSCVDVVNAHLMEQEAELEKVKLEAELEEVIIQNLEHFNISNQDVKMQDVENCHELSSCESNSVIANDAIHGNNNEEPVMEDSATSFSNNSPSTETYPSQIVDNRESHLECAARFPKRQMEEKNTSYDPLLSPIKFEKVPPESLKYPEYQSVKKNINLPCNLELDEKVQKKQEEIKQKFSDAFKSNSNKSFEDNLTECTKEFRQYLSSIGINQDKKKELITQLEKSLSLLKQPKKNKHQNSPKAECHKVVSNSVPTSKISETDKNSTHNFDVNPSIKSTETSESTTSELSKSQCKETNLDDANEPMDTSEPNELIWLDPLMVNYYEKMKIEVMQKNYVVTNDSYDKIHEEVIKTIKNQKDFQKILDCQKLKDSFDTAIADAKHAFRFEVKELRKDRKNKLVSVLSKWEDYISNNFDELIKSPRIYFDTKNYLRNLLVNAVKNEIPYSYNQSYLHPLLLEYAMTTEKFKTWVEWINKLETCFTSYQVQMDKKLELFRCLEETKFNEFHQQCVDQMQIQEIQTKDKTHEKVSALMGKCFDHLKKRYNEINKEILRFEENVPSFLKQNINAAGFYREMMDAITKRKVFSEKDLATIHNIVTEEILTAFNKSCDFKSGQNIQNAAQWIREELQTSYQIYDKTNKTRFEFLKTKTEGLVARQRKLYNDKMNEFLPSRGPSKIDLELKRNHKEYLVEVTKLLKMEISVMEVDIDGSHYVSSLQDNVEKDWAEFQKLNAKLRKKEFQDKKRLKEEEEMRKAETEKEENKRQARQELLAEEEKAKQKKTEKKEQVKQENHENQPSTSISCKLTNKVKEKRLSATTNESKLQPIAIEFEFSKVRVAYAEGKFFSLISNPLDQEFTPTLLAVDQNNEIFIGDEAKDHSDCIDLDTILKRGIGTRTDCYINGKRKPLDPEVLCALFLLKVKSNVEDKMNGRWTTVVITVPLCFSSVQRQMMKDAAFLAGFESIHLINNTSASAYYLANFDPYSESKENSCILVVFQGNGYFDGAIYKHLKGEIEMDNSFGNLHSSVPVPGRIQVIKNKLNNIKSLFAGEKKGQKHHLLKEWIGQDKDNITSAISISYESRNDLINLNGLATNARTIAHEISKISIVFGAALFAQALEKSDGTNFKRPIKDKATYNFVRPGLRGKQSKIIYEYQALTSDVVSCHHTVGQLCSFHFTTNITIQEISFDTVFNVGTICIEPANYDNEKADVNINFGLTNEGILKIQEVFWQLSGNRKKNHLPFEWKHFNLSATKKTELKELVLLMQKDEKKEALKKAKQELKNLVEMIQRRFSEIQKQTGKMLLEREVASAEALLDHRNSTQEMVENKITLLEGYVNRYLPG